MSQETVVFCDTHIGKESERVMVADVVRKHVSIGPVITVKLNQLGEMKYVKAGPKARKCEFIAAYEYAKKFYIILGHDLIQTLIDQHGLESEVTFQAKLVTKHILKRSEPGQVNLAPPSHQEPPRPHYGQNNRDQRSWSNDRPRRPY